METEPLTKKQGVIKAAAAGKGIAAKRVMKRRATCSCSMPGVWRALSHVSGAAVVFHSPRACAHIARRMDINAFYRNFGEALKENSLPVIPLLSSDLEEEEAVFGGEERLKRAIRYAAEKYRPKVIFIANSCVSGVIGDDVEAVAADMEQELGFPVLAVAAHGFLDGEYFKGYIDAARLLMERFMKPAAAKEEGTVLLLGDCGGFYGRFAEEIKRLLGYFDLRVTGQFPTYIDIDRLAQASSASLTVVLGRYGQDARQKALVELAEEMKEKFGIPCMRGDIYPVGFRRTLVWIEELGKTIGREEAAAAAVAAEREAFQAAIDRAKTTLGGTKTVLCAGRVAQYFQPEEVFYLLEKLEVKILGVTLFDCYRDAERRQILERLQKATDAPILSEEEAAEAFREADYVLTTNELLAGQLCQVYLPYLSGAGWSGERDILRALERACCRRFAKGGMIYA